MGFTAIPGGDVWLQIGTTQTPTSGSSVSFTSIPAVKKIRIVVDGVIQTASSAMYLTFNNDTSSIYSYGYVGGTSTIAFSILRQANVRVGRAASSVAMFGDLTVDYANQLCPKLITGASDSRGANGDGLAAITGNYNSTATINRIDLVSNSSTFSAANTGTFAIYGAF
jgi:hypothetical protein